MDLLTHEAELRDAEHRRRLNDTLMSSRVSPFVDHRLWIERTPRLRDDGGESVSRDDAFARDSLKVEGETDDLIQGLREDARHFGQEALTRRRHASDKKDDGELFCQASFAP